MRLIMISTLSYLILGISTSTLSTSLHGGIMLAATILWSLILLTALTKLLSHTAPNVPSE